MSYVKGLKEALKIVESAQSLEMASDLIQIAINEAPEDSKESSLALSKNKIKQMLPGSSEEAISNAGTKIAGAATKIVASAVKQEISSQMRKAIRSSIKNIFKK
jgi:hypothetical protein